MPTVPPIYVADSSGQEWQLACDNNGNRIATKVFNVQNVPSYILVNDISISQTYQLTIAMGSVGVWQLTPVGSATSPQTIYVNSPNGNTWAIQISNGILQQTNTNVGSPCCVAFSDFRNTLAQRLADSNKVFWTDAELKVYITEALRTWNALTETWLVDYSFSTTAGQPWYDTGSTAGSPRNQSVLDSDLYTIMQYHLLESPSGGGSWAGTSQFSLSDLSGALQRRINEMIQRTGCNLADNFTHVGVNVRKFALSCQVLEGRRLRFLPDSGASNVTLIREDRRAWTGFNLNYPSASGLPSAWDMASEPPQTIDLNSAPTQTGTYDLINVQAGPTFAPPVSSLLGVPDDWSWIAKWGALADLLGRDSEATDRARADYCLKRFEQGIKIMQASNWLMLATINGTPVDIVSLRDKDGFSPEWQDNPNAWPSMVVAGTDFLAPCPVAANTPVIATVVGNAPIPVLDADCISMTKDVQDAILDYAQVLASFKMGGVEFSSTKDLEDKFLAFAVQTNRRLLRTGLFVDILHMEGTREDISQPRE